MVTKGSRKQVGARIAADLYRDLKLLAVQKDAKVGELVEEAIRRFLKSKRRK
ncbi:MAG: hypothetical protein ACT4O1_14790 [Gemmatimonadota bacterium]